MCACLHTLTHPSTLKPAPQVHLQVMGFLTEALHTAIVVTPRHTLVRPPRPHAAYFRGIPFCSWAWASRYGGRFDVCPRTYLAQLTERDKEAGNGTVLDVSFSCVGMQLRGHSSMTVHGRH